MPQIYFVLAYLAAFKFITCVFITLRQLDFIFTNSEEFDTFNAFQKDWIFLFLFLT